MMVRKSLRLSIPVLALIGTLLISCAPRRAVRYTLSPLPQASSLAVIVDSPNNIKNIVLMQFLKSGYRVKAFNATDFYTLSDVYDLKDFKRISYYSGSDNSLISMEKSFNNIYKLHIYNFELNKADTLDEIRNKFNVQYLVLLDLKNWEQVSWGRAIDLRSQELVWVENYPTKYGDSVEKVVAHMIDSMSKR
ncbi:MAG: hypothetical protein JXA20_14625 [Spirochaetes bacterium]|nr:hypothetical protein [Spirochaetota bacterium]